MSTIRDPAYITDAGRTMMTAGGDVTYTKAVLYGQDISHLTSDQVKALTTIGSLLKEVPVGVSDKQSNGKDTTVVLEATFQNDGLTADLPYTAVGFFAKKGEDEKLIIVAVANAGAYLAATRPDGVATDALDLKVAIAIGDATNVTAVVDPAASVTPATLNGAINETKQVLTALIDTKASQSNLDQTNAEVAKKADSEAVNSQLATKANTTDIDKQVKTLNDAINTKADKATVDAEIAKIDFTPYAKNADVDTKIKAVSDEIATKVGADYSYSKAQLDEKLLALSTDTNGKVSADQVTALIADKANKADVDKSFKAVNDSLATKADQATTYSKTDVDKLLSAKDDTTDVDAKIKTVTDLANQLNNNKADKSNTYTKTDVDNKVNEAKSNAQSSDNQIWGEVNKLSGKQTVDKADANNLTASGTYYISNPNQGKNFPTGSWGNLLVSNGNDHRTSQLYFPDDGGCFWFRVLDENSWHNWVQVADKADITNLQNQINNNDKATITTGFDWNSASPNNETRSIQAAWLVDQDALHGGVTRMNNLQDQINQKLQFIQGQDSYDVLAIDGFAGIIEFNNRANLKNLPPMGNKTWTYILKLLRDDWGTVLVYSQDNTVWQNALNGTTWSGWVRLATSIDVNSLQNLINQQNQTIQSLTTRLTNAENEINYIKANYIEGRRFPASQEAQANSWENENPQRLAFITK